MEYRVPGTSGHRDLGALVIPIALMIVYIRILRKYEQKK